VRAASDIGRSRLARELVLRAIARGKDVVTANKDLIATEGPWLAAFAARTGASLRYEAAVGGAIPIVRALGRSLAGEDVVEEEMLPEPDVMEAIPGYDDEARTLYTGGLTETDADTLAE